MEHRGAGCLREEDEFYAARCQQLRECRIPDLAVAVAEKDLSLLAVARSRDDSPGERILRHRATVAIARAAAVLASVASARRRASGSANDSALR